VEIDEYMNMYICNYEMNTSVVMLPVMYIVFIYIYNYIDI